MIDRICKVLYGMESVFDGLICDHWPMWVEHLPEGGVLLHHKLYRWHPSYWLGFIRCVCFNDKCGSARYERAKRS